MSKEMKEIIEKYKQAEQRLVEAEQDMNGKLEQTYLQAEQDMESLSYYFEKKFWEPIENFID